jgi:hypothetical protein
MMKGGMFINIIKLIEWMRLRWKQVFVNTWDWNRKKGNLAGFYINKKNSLDFKIISWKVY